MYPVHSLIYTLHVPLSWPQRTWNSQSKSLPWHASLLKAKPVGRLLSWYVFWYVSVHSAQNPFLLSNSRSLINSMRPRQNDRHFPDDTFKRIFVNENVRISIKISLKFVSKGPINNNPALVQIMAWRRSGDKPLSEPIMVSLLTHICVTRPQWVKWDISWQNAFVNYLLFAMEISETACTTSKLHTRQTP